MEALAALPDDAPLLDKILIRHRRTVGNIMLWLLHDEAIFIESGILIPLVIVETLWWCQAFQHNYFALFSDKYPLSITMVITFLYGLHIIFIWQGFWSAGGWDDQWRWRSCCLSGEFQSFLIQSQHSTPSGDDLGSGDRPNCGEGFQCHDSVSRYNHNVCKTKLNLKKKN